MKEKFLSPNGHYFLSHSVGCLPASVEASVHKSVFSPWHHKGGDAWPGWLDTLMTFHNRIAALLNVDADYVCAQSNLSSALTKILTGLPNSQKPKTVLMHENAFPSMGFVVQALAKYGFELKLISAEHSPCDIATWESALEKDTVDVCVITHVHSNTGQKSPVEQISALCRQKQVISIVDVAQSVGIVPIDGSVWDVDVIMGSCVKWLCGGPGAGFVWVKPELLHGLDVSDVGWFSHENPFEFDIHHFKPASNGMKLLGGTPSIAPYAVASESISVLQDIGLNEVYQHNLNLKRSFIDHVTALLTSEPDFNQQGGTLCLAFENDNLIALCEHLKSRNVYFDQRGNVIRVSMHIYNTQDDIEALSDILVTEARTIHC